MVEAFQAPWDGFAGYGIRNERLELVVLPELGAKVISLRSVLTGREFMWLPEGGLRLFPNRAGDSFENSTLAGADECFPTVSPCTLAGRDLPDHGEAWSSPWDIDTGQWRQGVLCTRLHLPVSPFHLERRISLAGNEAVFQYRLCNRAETDQVYLWAFHPLFPIGPGDRIVLPEAIRTVRATAAAGALSAKTGSSLPWPEPMPGVRMDRLELANGYAKCFANFAGSEQGWAAFTSAGERLTFLFFPSQVPSLGIWITRGGWNGHTHLALEPTSAAADRVSDVRRCEANPVPPGGERSWSFRLRLDNE